MLNHNEKANPDSFRALVGWFKTENGDYETRRIRCTDNGELLSTDLKSLTYGSDGKTLYPDAWSHRGPASETDPGYGWNADGTLAWEIIGNSPVLGGCDSFYKKTYAYAANGLLSTESGWVRL